MLVLLMAALTVPSVQVDGSGLSDPSTNRRIVGHVIERLLEVGIGVDPRSPSRLELAETDAGISVALLGEHAQELARADVADPGGAATLHELEVVQVAVDLALAHAPASGASKNARKIVVAAGLEDRRADVLAAANAAGVALVPDTAAADAVICVADREGDWVLAEVETEAECESAIAEAPSHETVADAWQGLQSDEPVAEDLPATSSRPSKDVARREPATPSVRRPWSAIAGVALGVLWRPLAFDPAPAMDFEIASPIGLALGVSATFVPSRGTDLTALDTMLAAGIGYRTRFGAHGRLSVVPSGGVSVHATWRGDASSVRVDPLIVVPLVLEALVHRHVAVGGRLSLSSTFRGRVHTVNDIELWRRGALGIMLAATLRFGG